MGCSAGPGGSLAFVVVSAIGCEESAADGGAHAGCAGAGKL